MIDYYSNFIEVEPLEDITSKTTVRKMKQKFSRQCIPRILVTDNGLQFSSEEFRHFSDKWEFEHNTSSPYHPEGNGKAESAVKVMKQLIAKALAANYDLWLSLLELRSTPTQGMVSTPAQRLLSRRTRTLLPIKDVLLKPQVVEHVSQKAPNTSKIS